MTPDQCRHLGYVAGAPRVSTRDDAESSGPRAHVVGVINAFRALGWHVTPFVVGDLVPKRWVMSGSRDAISKSITRRVVADVARVAMRTANRRWALRRIGLPDLVYERFGAFQSIGSGFQRKGVTWILETNSPLFLEAATRGTIAFGELERRLELKAYKQCDILVCVTETLKGIVVNALDIDPHKVIVIPNGVDTEMFDPRRHPATRVTNEFAVGFVGNMYGWAGLDVLLRSIHDLRIEGVPINAVLVGDGRERSSLQEMTQELGISCWVHFVGRVPWSQVPQYIGGFDVCYSGQVPVAGVGAMYHSPLKLYEYMACGKPVVASDYDDTRRTIVNGDNGYVFQPGSVESLNAALRSAYRNREELEQMGERARRRVVERHSWRVRTSYLIDRVEQIVGRSIGRRKL